MRLFYNDHIDARYMAERFGIKYRTASGETVEIAADGFYVGGKSLINGYKLYVAEEQYHIFKAQGGEVIKSWYDHVNIKEPELSYPDISYEETFDCGNGVIKFCNPEGYCGEFDRLSYHRYEIIMRDGKHFFMPEVEQ